MGQVGDGTVVAPFANAAMRLLREDWKGKYGSKMLSEELYPILQTGIPQPDQTFQNFVTINAGQDNAFMQFIDKYGNVLYSIDGANGLQKIESPGYPPPKLRPRIVWGPKTINSGDAIGGSELDAVAVDPETGATVAGSYVYTPASGTTFTSPPDTATLYVDFTPTDGVKYRRAKGSTVLTVVNSTPTFGYLDWFAPADIWADGTLGGAQLNAVARDGITNNPIIGTYVYTPASGATIAAPASGTSTQSLHCDFTPTSPADLATYGIISADTDVVVLGIFRVSGTASSSPTVIGDLIVVGAETTHSATGVTVSVSDTQGNSYTQAGTYVESSSGGVFVRVSLWYAFANSTAANTVTITPSAGSLGAASKCALYRGVLSFDGTSNGSGVGGTATVGATPVSGTREIIVYQQTSNFSAATFLSPWGIDNAKTVSEGENWLADPATGTGSAQTIVTGGTITGPWAIITASFKHRTS